MPAEPSPAPSTETPSPSPFPSTEAPVSVEPSPAPSTETPSPVPSPSPSTEAPVPVEPSPAPSTETPVLSPAPTPVPVELSPAPSTEAPVPSTEVPTLAPPPNAPPAVRERLLAQHNIIRSAHELNPVTWDTSLGVRMQAWANSCPGFRHGGPDGAQNLARYSPCASEVECKGNLGAAWRWYDTEVENWSFENDVCYLTDGCGNLSNMLGSDVTSIGCGYSECSDGNWVWCNYNGGEIDPVIPDRTISKTELRNRVRDY